MTVIRPGDGANLFINIKLFQSIFLLCRYRSASLWFYFLIDPIHLMLLSCLFAAAA